MVYSRASVLVLLFALVPLGCVTGVSNGVSESSSGAGGYFVVLAAQSTSKETLALYDGLHDAIDAYNRHEAGKAGNLSSYVEAFEANGYTRLADGKNEIECDLTKCLVKLSAKSLVSGEKDDSALVAQLTQALENKGLTPVRSGTGDTQQRTYTLGEKDGLHITCAQNGLPARASYRCDFDLDTGKGTPSVTEAVLDPAVRGKLVSCALSPGTVRSAEEARAELDAGGLLELTAPGSSNGKPVGYLRYAGKSPDIEFVDLFLCGDLTHDHFFVEGSAKQPTAWVTRGAKLGTSKSALDSLREDDAYLVASSTLTDETADGYVLEVRFKLARDAGVTEDVYGEDRFVLRVAKAWLK